MVQSLFRPLVRVRNQQPTVIPAEAGIQEGRGMDSRLRGSDEGLYIFSYCCVTLHGHIVPMVYFLMFRGTFNSLDSSSSDW